MYIMRKFNFLLFVIFTGLACVVSSCEEEDEELKSPKFHNGHEYVDLGLSVMWAKCNVGASSPEQSGGYFAWGETSSKEWFGWDNYVHTSNGSVLGINKYSDGSYGDVVDYKWFLDSCDDVACVVWGGDWRMPTPNEAWELHNECEWEWAGNGYLVTGPNGNSIFLPAAGYYWRGEKPIRDLNKGGLYWTNGLSEWTYCAMYIPVGPSKSGVTWTDRAWGGSIRPVLSKNYK